MRYATDPVYGDKIAPTPGESAKCPVCDQPVRAKCGQVNAWHWAHVSQEDCDPWFEPISQWHLDWQAIFPRHYREIVMGPHRADIGVPGGVLELQHSHLSVDEIRERETFYRRQGHFAWLFDAREAYDEGRLDLRVKPSRAPDFRTFRWKHARKSIAAARAAVYLDLGNAVLRLGRIHAQAPVGGWGLLRTREEFITEFAVDAYRRTPASSDALF